ncbi:PREDICTED: flotillin-2-like [Rhagoletis zephyria]|uniref:flotillin-2-like n=1 Tax=Rhagoletis zephyria TaxID=28612 RepID=UPI0008119DCA|nr:PREDICTED: flotillin-2-like [Rhagoletis zephyria]
MGNINTTGPNEALVVSGGCCTSTKKTFVVGGWAWSWWLLSNVQRISLETMTLTPKCVNVETSEGVPLTVTCIAQCKIMNEKELLTIACEQFLGKTVEHIHQVVLLTLEGHLRAILGTMTVEEIYRERDQFAQLVREVATNDVGRMGIEILSFTIKDVFDSVEYLSSLGKTKTAEVKRNAAVGVANSERDAGIRESECQKAAMDIKFSADSKIEDSTRQFLTQKAQYDTEVNYKKADASLAYDLESTRIDQQIAFEKKQIDLVQRKKQIIIQEQENTRIEKEIQGDIRLVADAQAHAIKEKAAGSKSKVIAEAEANARKLQIIGEAQARAIEAKGLAEAEEMRIKAAAYKQYGDAAILALTLDSLPKIAAEIAAPLSKTDQIVLLSGDTGDLNKIAAQVPPAIQALTGLEIAKVCSQYVVY